MKNKSIIAQSVQGAELRMSYKSTVKQKDRTKVTSSKIAADYLRMIWEDFGDLERVESAVVLCLNQGNQIINWFRLSSGGINGTVVDRRIVFQAALLSNAVAVMIAHNHPSGNLCPSNADKLITEQIVSAGKTLDIRVLDHIIITEEGYFSFSDLGLLTE